MSKWVLIVHVREIKDTIRQILFSVVHRRLGARVGSRGLLFLEQGAGKEGNQRLTMKTGGTEDQMSWSVKRRCIFLFVCSGQYSISKYNKEKTWMRESLLLLNRELVEKSLSFKSQLWRESRSRWQKTRWHRGLRAIVGVGVTGC